MTKTEAFDKFLNNIKVDNPDIFCGRYKEITKKLNKTFRDTDSETANCLQVGSYGRYTGIKGISDLDMLYIMPKSTWDTYKDTPSELLRKTRDALLDRYPQTTIKVDRLVVDVFFGNFTFEVQPVYEERDGEEINNYETSTRTK
jgi:tRNA nucleotidyltransferase (CCA-adding enzyme)